MNQVYLDVFKIVKASLYNEVPDVSQNPDWEAIFHIICDGKLIGITNKSVKKITGVSSVPEKLMQEWDSAVFSLGFAQMCANSEMARVISEFKNQNIQLVLFKGYALAALYPEPNMRFSSDADLYIDETNQKRAREILEALGFWLDPNVSKEHVPVYRIKDLDNNKYLTIELHDRLWEDYEGTLTKTLDDMQLTLSDKLIDIKFNNQSIKTLGYTEHLIFQIYHIAKHLSFKALELRYLCDITLFVNAYKNAIDWKRFNEMLDSIGYKTFCDNIFRLCIDYLGLDSCILSEINTDKSTVDSLIEDIMILGQIDDNNVLDWESTNQILLYFLHDTSAASTPFMQKVKIFFPLPKDLKEKFSYAKRCPLLLPVAWIHRYISAVIYSINAKKRGHDAKNVLSKAEYRLALMKEIGLTI